MPTIADILNPWGALRRVREELEREQLATERLTRQVTNANNRADQHSLTALARSNELARVETLLKKAHFRNPKTGRLGRQGERFE